MPRLRNSGIVRYDSASITYELFYVAAPARRPPASEQFRLFNLPEVPPLTFRCSRLCSGYGWFIPISRPFAQNSFVRTPARSVGTGVVRVLRFHDIF